jgi:hypothetical protein
MTTGDQRVVVTPEMIEAGKEAALGYSGAADLFSASDLAVEVYRAMHEKRCGEALDKLKRICGDQLTYNNGP